MFCTDVASHHHPPPLSNLRPAGTVGEVLGRFPAIQNMMHKAQMRKKKNMYILSCVIATCIIIILLFIIG